MNTGIILAAGHSSRFLNGPKQLHILNSKTILAHSVEAMSILDEIIIVTNSDCFRQVKKLFKHVKVIKSDTDCRLSSIKAGLEHIKQSDNVLIHDAARPFVTQDHIQILLDSSKEYVCSQFYFKLVNGLIKRGERLEVVNRDEYIELVTPQIIDYRLARDLFENKINSEECEITPLLSHIGIRSNLIEGSSRYLRKITTLDDLC